MGPEADGHPVVPYRTSAGMDQTSLRVQQLNPEWSGPLRDRPGLARRNERERKRVRRVNLAFALLRQHLPRIRPDKKPSKVETLRSAIGYIKQLQLMLAQSDSSILHGVSGTKRPSDCNFSAK